MHWFCQIVQQSVVSLYPGKLVSSFSSRFAFLNPRASLPAFHRYLHLLQIDILPFNTCLLLTHFLVMRQDVFILTSTLVAMCCVLSILFKLLLDDEIVRVCNHVLRIWCWKSSPSWVGYCEYKTLETLAHQKNTEIKDKRFL